ncbi:hypothetical protein KI387_032906, partial [Taxus chinensis]
MASCSSSHQQNQEHQAFPGIEHCSKRRKVDESSRLYDVFINHRGPDVKDTLATQLYNSLQQLGVRAFLDSEEKRHGDSFPSTIETAIRSASVQIAIVSKRYAESSWCLDELGLMLQSQSKIIPVFYGVEPWELRHIEIGGKGVYANAFTKYREKGRYLNKLGIWKEALHSASLITGFQLKNSVCASSVNSLDFNSSEEFINMVLAVQKEVKRKQPLFVARYPVALKKLVEDFERRCVDGVVQDFERRCHVKEKHHSKIIGIYGMGGAGKTTLAKELFNRKRSGYIRDSFLFDVREASAKKELPSLQRKLIKDLFDEDPRSFHSIEEGICILRERLAKSEMLSFLIVLDDINDVKQLDALLFMDMQNSYANSLVIITTRDLGVLTGTGIPICYGLEGMNKDDGRELFCWHSLGQSHPASGYENVVDGFLQVCAGLPLSLQVLGRHVYGKPEHYWQLELGKARRSMHRDIKDRLKISVDALDWEEKQIFMDIACFFANKPKSVAIRSWEGSGWSVHLALEMLKDKCLVDEIETCRLDVAEPMWVWDRGTDLGLRMHDHLRDLGREMANESNNPRRLWRSQDLKSLELEGFQSILSQTKGIPSCIHLQNLQCLRINNGHLRRLWESHIQAPSQLKELQISQTSLEEFPDLSRIADTVEMVVLDAEEMSTVSWSVLASLNPVSLILRHSRLRGELASNYRLRTTSFKSSYSPGLIVSTLKIKGEFPLNNFMSNLKILEISTEELSPRISISENHCHNLESLKLHDMKNLTEVDVTRVTNLVVFDI